KASYFLFILLVFNELQLKLTRMDEMTKFLEGPKEYLEGQEAPSGGDEAFLRLALRARQLANGLEPLPEEPMREVKAHLGDLFVILAKHRFEFGYRTAGEVLKYLRVSRHLATNQTAWDGGGWRYSLDDQIVQKLLPKLHGSMGRIGGLLARLAFYCHTGKDHTTRQKSST
ncbi:hypothetical protein ACFSYE_15255, partial [Roseibacillus ishigakijimensis]